eukprot:SAG25_NODE_6070_length_591_cov_1.993902_1_plen_79_part_00
MVRSLSGHAHWVNTMALNNEHVLRVGGFNPDPNAEKSGSLFERAQAYYSQHMKVSPDLHQPPPWKLLDWDACHLQRDQ